MGASWDSGWVWRNPVHIDTYMYTQVYIYITYVCGSGGRGASTTYEDRGGNGMCKIAITQQDQLHVATGVYV